MRALLLVPNSGLVAEDLLGMPIGLRAVFAAIDAGAVAVEYDATHAAIFGTWAKDERVTRPLIAHATAHPSPSLSPSPNPTPNPTPNPIPTPTPTPTPESAREERLVLRTDAVVSPALLTELTLGNALHDASGVPLAARLLLSTTADAAAALAAAPAQAFVVDRYRYAILLASARDRRRAERAMLASLVKPSDGPVSRHINRPISTTVTRMLVPFGVSPNQMTWVTLLVALTGAWYAAHSSFRMQALGAVLFQLSSILDGCDGEIARLTRRSSAHGALLDSLVDDVSNLVFFSALSWGVAHDLAHDSARWPAFAGTATALCYVGVITVQYAFVLRATGHGDKTSFWTPEPGAQHSPLMAFFHGFLRRNVFVAVIMLAVLADCSSWVVAALPFATLGTLSASVRRALAT